MKEIGNNIVYVEGARNGAIYNLNSGEVYSINYIAKEILNKYINKFKLGKQEKEYIELLVKNNLLDTKRKICKYIPQKLEKRLRLVWFEITQGCNMKCVHCYEGHIHQASKNVLSIAEWKNVIKDTLALKPQRVVIIGGEPCIHKNIIEILKYTRELDSKVSITLFTNGYFIEGELFDTIIEQSIEVKVSLYGHCSEVHDKITGVEGSFLKLKNVIIQLGERKVPINVAVTLMRENEEYVDDIQNLLKKMPIRGYKFDVIREVVDGTQNEHIPKKKNVIETAYRTSPNFFVKKQQFDLNYYNNSCWYGKLVITETGDILPCVFARNHICGNIKKTNIADIIENNMKEFWEYPVSSLKECNNCEFKYACHDCRPIAESAYDMNKKNPRCRYNPYEGVWENV